MSNPPFTLRSERDCVRAGFTLVEVVLAIGLISFSFLAIVGLMAAAQRSSREASERTAMTLILQSACGTLSSLSFTNLRTALALPEGAWMGFEQEGRFLGRTNSVSALNTNTFYRVQVKPLNPASLTNYSRVSGVAVISFPPPAFNQTNSFPVCFPRYGSQY